MSFWIVSVFILSATLITIIVPMMRSRASRYDEYNNEIYQDQINEIKRDLDRGILDPIDGEALKTELEKKLEENSSSKAKFNSDTTSAKSPIRSAIVLAGIIPFMSYGLYHYLGSPNKPGLPFGERPFNSSLSTADAEMDSLVEKLRDRLSQNPDQLTGWILLGKSLISLNRFADAANAFKQAFKIAPDRAEIAASIAETKFMSMDGRFDMEVRDFFKTAQRLNPKEHKALFYLGLDAFMTKQYPLAIQLWVDLISISPVGAPWLDGVRGRLIEAADAGDLKISNFTSRLELKSETENKSQQNNELIPTQEDIKNANEMSEKERKNFIRSMVERLADRLESEPNDLDGWRRLARAYRVLGEKKKAAMAERRIKDLEKSIPKK